VRQWEADGLPLLALYDDDDDDGGDAVPAAAAWEAARPDSAELGRAKGSH
jgi:hypothetical protein